MASRQGSAARREARLVNRASRGAPGAVRGESGLHNSNQLTGQQREMLGQEVSFGLLPGGELSEEEDPEDGDLTPRVQQLHSVREEKEPKEGAARSVWTVLVCVSLYSSNIYLVTMFPNWTIFRLNP